MPPLPELPDVYTYRHWKDWKDYILGRPTHWVIEYKGDALMVIKGTDSIRTTVQAMNMAYRAGYTEAVLDSRKPTT